MIKKLFKLRAQVGVCFILLSLSNISTAQDILVSADLGVDVFYDDQFDLEVGEEDASAAVVRPVIVLTRQGQEYQNTIQVGAVLTEFIDSIFEDSSNFNAGWTLQRQGELSQFSFAANYSERLIDELIQLDDLQFSNNQVVETISASPSYSISLSQLSQLQLSYAYVESRIRGPEDDFDRDNLRHNAAVGWSRTLSERSTFNLAANYQLFQPSGGGVADQNIDSTNIGITVGGNYLLGERWTVNGNVGLNQVNFDEDPALADGDAPVADGDIVVTAAITTTYNTRRNEFTIGVNAGNTQQLDGVVDDQQSLSIAWDRSFSERLNSTVTGQVFQSSRNDRRNTNIEASLNWQPSLRWAFRLAYQYRDQRTMVENTGFELSTESDRITLSVDFSFDDFSL